MEGAIRLAAGVDAAKDAESEVPRRAGRPAKERSGRRLRWLHRAVPHKSHFSCGFAAVVGVARRAAELMAEW